MTFISPVQEEYLACKISNPTKSVGIDWSINERLKTIRTHSYWNK